VIAEARPVTGLMGVDTRPRRRIDAMVDTRLPPPIVRPTPAGPTIIPGRIKLPPEYSPAWAPSLPEVPRYIDFSQLPPPPWSRLRREYDRWYGFVTPTVLEGTQATEPLRAFRRWRFVPHARQSLLYWTELGNILACGVEWLEREETPEQRAVPGVFLTNRGVSEVRPLQPGECELAPDGLDWWRCPVCGYRVATISGGAGASYWIAPSGSDSANGSQATPWQTFGKAMSVLTAGDTLNVNNGNYGRLQVNGANGTSGAIGIIQAVNERQAILSASNQNTVDVLRNWWHVIGLACENDRFGTNHDLGMCLNLDAGSFNPTDCAVMRCLFRRNNRGADPGNPTVARVDTNVQAVALYGTRNLAYESELYEHNRYFDFIGGNNGHLVRCYINQRGEPTTSGGGPTLGFYFYTGDDHLGENNLVEQTGRIGSNDGAYGCQGQYRPNRRPLFYGNLSRATAGVAISIASSDFTGNLWPIDTVIENAFCLQNSTAAWVQDSQNTIVRQFTADGKTQSIDAPGWGADGAENSLAFWTMFLGGSMEIGGQGGGAAVRFCCARGGFFLQGGTVQQGNTTSLNPPGGIIRPWTEDSSALKNAGNVGAVWPTGASAANIGCDILYAYQNGVLTSPPVPLWDSATGAFLLRGATLAGWNTVSGSSLFDAHTRFNVDPLKFPVGYAGTGPQSAPGLNSVWDASSTPGRYGGADGPVELGMRFRPFTNGQVLAIRFYKHPSNTGTHVGKLYDNAGALLASVTFTGETASGWQEQALSTPIAIVGGQTYVVTYTAAGGFYALDPNYFSANGFAGTTLQALQDGVDGLNGCYKYPSGFPDSGFGSNYWVDLVFALTGAGARSFNGINQAEQSAAAIDLTGTAKITISMWARRNT
jgi:Domain of unknown function (DUF4082)